MPDDPSQRRYHNCTIEIVCGDIAAQADMACVVNAANAALMPGGGVAGALHAAAGPQLAEACAPLAPILPGQAVITPAFDLPNDWVIHCLGPRFGIDEPAAALLRECYVKALALCEHRGIESVAFPAISTGAFGYPPGPAAEIAIDAILDSLSGRTGPRQLRLVLWDRDDMQVCRRALERCWQEKIEER